MVEIITSLVPGQYPTGQTLTVTFPAGTRRAIVTRDDRSPVLSEILAYDVGPVTPNPPWAPGQPGGPGPDVQRPFLAVTQDGRGNVVYDGGFPKFYNSSMARLEGVPGNQTWVWPTQPWSTWEELSGASKYMVNAFNFCADKRKVASGNRKVLVIGNTTVAASYPVKGSHYTPAEGQSASAETAGFMDTFRSIGTVGNWDVSFYDLKDAKGLIDLKYAQLDEYVLIVFLGSAGVDNITSPATISSSFPKDLALLRTTGTGIIIITDHTGYNYSSIQDALANPNGFVRDPNLIASEYGCYYSGNVDRQPVEVAEIKRQIGAPGPPQSHPLLTNLADTDYIYAGGSESLVYPELYTDEIVDHTQPLVIPLNASGTYRVNVLVQLEDGTILTKPMMFTIINPGDLELHDSFNRLVDQNSKTYKSSIDYSFHNKSDPTLTMTGELQRNGIIQGYFSYTQDNTSYYPFGGATPMVVANGDTITFSLKQPYEYALSIPVTIPDPAPYFSKSGNVADFIGQIKKHPYYQGVSDIKLIMADLQAYADKRYSVASYIGLSANQYYWKTVGKGRLPFKESAAINCTLAVYTNTAEWNANKPAFGNIGDAVIIADINDVYYWNNVTLAWTKHPQLASALFGISRNVKDTRSNNRWYINANSTNIIP